MPISEHFFPKILDGLSRLHYKSDTQSTYNKLVQTDPSMIVRISNSTHTRANSLQEKVLIEKGDPKLVMKYMEAAQVGTWPEAEPKLADNPNTAVWYAEKSKKQFPAGEAAIATNPLTALRYADKVLKKPFPAGEAAIATDVHAASYYAEHVLKGPFPLGQQTILASKDPNSMLMYAVHCLKTAWPEAEPFIAKDAISSYHYATHVLNARFPAGEPAIKEAPKTLKITAVGKNYLASYEKKFGPI
jgi:DNA-directed RNA polymerase subunit L